MDFPLPTRKQAPLLISHFNLSMAFQVWEAYFSGSFLSQSSVTLYLHLRASMQGLALLDTTIHVSFASIASLRFFAFRNPKPPWHLGLQRWSQDFQARSLPFSFFGFHQKGLMVESSLSHTIVKTSKVENVYVGRAWATDMMRVLRPA